jgi:hypothetical protein
LVAGGKDDGVATPFGVLAGLVPATHAARLRATLESWRRRLGVDARDKPGQDASKLKATNNWTNFNFLFRNPLILLKPTQQNPNKSLEEFGKRTPKRWFLCAQRIAGGGPRLVDLA